MNCEQCNDTGWIVGERGAKRCPHVEAATRTEQVGKISDGALATAVEALSAIAFFPKEPAARALIGDGLAAMCPNIEALRYVVRRAISLHQVWATCGLHGLRQILCAKHRPADGVEISWSERFPDGIPSETGRDPLALPPGATLQLPAGSTATADSELDARFSRTLSHMPVMSNRPMPDNKAAKRLREVLTPPQEREESPMKPPERGMTLERRAEIEAQIAQVLREKRERGQ